MDRITAEADIAYGTEGFFAVAKKSNWQTLNSFTHSGKLQVSRRFTGNDVEAKTTPKTS